MKKIKEFWNKGKWQKAIIIFICLCVVYLIALVATGNAKGETLEDVIISTLDDASTKVEDNTLIIHFRSDNQSSAEGTKEIYYGNVKKICQKIQYNAELDNYQNIKFVGNIMEDDKITCVMSGYFTVDEINNCKNFNNADIENSLHDLFIPKPLQ